MSKKFFFFGMAALLGASLFFLGCEGPMGPAGANGVDGANGTDGTNGTDGEDGIDGVPGLNGNPGAATLPSSASPELVAAYFRGADKVFLTGPLAATGTFVVPATKTLAVVGEINATTMTSVVINAFNGTLDVSAGSFTSGNGVTFLVPAARKAAVEAAAPGASVPEYRVDTTGASLSGDAVFESLPSAERVRFRRPIT